MILRLNLLDNDITSVHMMSKIILLDWNEIAIGGKPVDTSLYVHSEVTGNVTFQDTVLAHARTEIDMNTVDRL